ncbi:hypothetical protein F5884DRAFT_666913 [Xylogone sp. PMI_703]|nr:hypothetical protein F5884DRAFT_666913 [Xylogone sp. PMI_703]
MDPYVKEARERFLQPKAPPSRNPTLFQQQLAKNPYALALSTPIRRCAVTKIAMPSYFLQDFNLISDPTTGKPWYMPRSLARRRNFPQEHAPENDDSVTSELAHREQLSNTPTPTLGPRVYTLSRKSLLRLLVTKKSGYEKQWQRFPAQRMLAVRQFIGIKHKLSWREDMDDFVLELLRRRAVESLTYISHLKGRYLSRTVDWESALKKPQTGAFLWLGKEGIRQGKNTFQGGDETTAIPPEFATLQLGKTKRHKVPVHNLLLLLGENHLEKLRTVHTVFGESEILAVRNRKLTIELQLQLWKLQGYLAKHENISEE